MNRKIFGLFCILCVAGPALSAMDGREIMNRVDTRAKGATSHALVRMDLVDRKGSVNSRTVEMYATEDTKGPKRMTIVFYEPASVRNTRYLSSGDDRWIYLPALKRVRRIAASEGGGSFMGSDFTYDDMSDRDVDRDTHILLREEKLGTSNCHVVESFPVDPKDSQYSRRIAWVDADRWLPLKIELYDKSGNLLKTAEMEKTENIQGFWTPMRTVMRNVRTGTATVLDMVKFVWNEELPAGLFTTRFLETGRP